jgi:hypothetical protein
VASGLTGFQAVTTRINMIACANDNVSTKRVYRCHGELTSHRRVASLRTSPRRPRVESHQDGEGPEGQDDRRLQPRQLHPLRPPLDLKQAGLTKDEVKIAPTQIGGVAALERGLRSKRSETGARRYTLRSTGGRGSGSGPDHAMTITRA